MKQYSITAALFSAIWLVLPQEPHAAYHILFIGLTGQGAPAIERKFDTDLRQRLVSVPDCKMVDYDVAMRCRHLCDADRFPTVSRQHLMEMQPALPDPIIVVWGSINTLTIMPVREKLIKTVLRGELNMHLTLFSPDRDEYIYSGEVIATTARQKGFAGFAPVDKVTHITAKDRALLSDTLITNTALQTYGIITNALKEEHNTAGTAPPDTMKRNAPSISDVFTVPSVAPNDIRPKTSPADEGKGAKKAQPSEELKNKTTSGTN